MSTRAKKAINSVPYERRADVGARSLHESPIRIVWTVREIAKHAAVGGRGPVLVGSPEEVAEELIAWVEDTDVDGFNLAYAVMPDTFTDFVDLVVPELQLQFEGISIKTLNVGSTGGLAPRSAASAISPRSI